MTTENSSNHKTLVAFKPSNGITEYRVIIDKGADTIWATELQIATIFGRDRTVINKHIYKEGELSENSTCAIFALVRAEKDRK